MEFVAVGNDNIKTLFEMNRQLAIEEGQENLFTTGLENYSKGFLGSNSVAFGILCYLNDQIVGFVIFNYKFATYLGTKVLYLEDIYLKKEYCSEENKDSVLSYLISKAFKEGCERVEMRVLNNFNWGFSLLEKLGFEKIEKWSVYRLSKK